MNTNHMFSENVRMVAETYEKMRPSVIGYICKRLGGGLLAEAEDMCQDIFLQILTYDKDLSAEALPGLVYRMAHNHIVDYFRHHTRTLAAQEFFFRHSARSACMTEDLVAASEIERIEQEAVDMMSERKASVYLLYVHFGQSIDEISSSMNISRRTVENQVFRARQDVRATFDRFEFRNIHSDAS